MDIFERYSRQILFAPLGRAGQEKLLQGRVAIMGLGALGSSSATLLARAGVGFLRLIDRDFVEETNLQRQILYTEKDAADVLPKAAAAAARLTEINSTIVYEPVIEDVNYANIENILSGVDLVVDGSDNLEIRHLVNEMAVKKNLPWIYGACVASYGMTGVFPADGGACFNCFAGPLSASPTETCDTAGVIGPVAAVIASLQAGEAIKYISGNHSALNAKMRYLDLWTNQYHEFTLAKREDCPVCGTREFPLLNGQMKSQATYLCGRNMVQVSPSARLSLSLTRLEEKLAPLGVVKNNGYLLSFLAGDKEIIFFPDGRALVKGTDNEALARSLYMRYLVN